MECTLAVLFLRRYVQYCARRKRNAALQGAALLHREVARRYSYWRASRQIDEA